MEGVLVSSQAEKWAFEGWPGRAIFFIKAGFIMAAPLFQIEYPIFNLHDF